MNIFDKNCIIIKKRHCSPYKWKKYAKERSKKRVQVTKPSVFFVFFLICTMELLAV